MTIRPRPGDAYIPQPKHGDTFRSSRLNHIAHSLSPSSSTGFSRVIAFCLRYRRSDVSLMLAMFALAYSASASSSEAYIPVVASVIVPGTPLNALMVMFCAGCGTMLLWPRSTSGRTTVWAQVHVYTALLASCLVIGLAANVVLATIQNGQQPVVALVLLAMALPHAVATMFRPYTERPQPAVRPR